MYGITVNLILISYKSLVTVTNHSIIRKICVGKNLKLHVYNGVMEQMAMTNLLTIFQLGKIQGGGRPPDKVSMRHDSNSNRN